MRKGLPQHQRLRTVANLQRFGSPGVSPELAGMKWYVVVIYLYLQTMFDYNNIEIYYLVEF